MKTLELNTGLFRIFNGCYQSIWEIQDIDDDGNELEVEYNFKDFMKGIANAYNSQTFQIEWYFKQDAPFIKKLRFLGTFYSPREYNFETDTLDFELDFDKDELMKKLDELKTDGKFRKFLSENYSSRDGFWSFTPNNYDELREQIETEGDKYTQSMGALLSYLIDEKTQAEIEMDVYDFWQGNGYGGTDYTSKPYETI
jgi:hypothetical protein